MYNPYYNPIIEERVQVLREYAQRTARPRRRLFPRLRHTSTH